VVASNEITHLVLDYIQQDQWVTVIGRKKQVKRAEEKAELTRFGYRAVSRANRITHLIISHKPKKKVLIM